eukprot:TRINITY_DN2964_c0_g1_i1.p1 TRINITY_DN2964_c0_g1~~TRINITY_DN2964_c0_g1_i1.p1  ORF type:complete len:276 (+),score=99.34 TRINITY_DN2964_c0_g1_i1:48-875(+)
MNLDQFQLIKLEKKDKILEIILNSPKRLNSIDDQFMKEIGAAAKILEEDNEISVAIVWAEGRMFTAGLDLKSQGSVLQGDGEGSHATQSLVIYRHLKAWQKHFQSLRDCSKPVIAAIHGPCIGGGIDLITACDVRLATKDCIFSIRETKVGIVADLGTLQRIVKLTSAGFIREMAFTGSNVTASRAHHFGFVNEVYENKEAMLEAARKMAREMADNSLLILQGTKIALNYADDHTVEESLNQVALWNSAFLQSEDLIEAFSSFIQKTKPVFRNKL